MTSYQPWLSTTELLTYPPAHSLTTRLPTKCSPASFTSHASQPQAHGNLLNTVRAKDLWPSSPRRLPKKIRKGKRFHASIPAHTQSGVRPPAPAPTPAAPP